jgi:hypothetical protein
MTDETRIALKNYDWLIRNRDDTHIQWESDTLLYGDGGCKVEELVRLGMTPATEDED